MDYVICSLIVYWFVFGQDIMLFSITWWLRCLLLHHILILITTLVIYHYVFMVSGPGHGFGSGFGLGLEVATMSGY
jgi:hypothetical protein